MIAKYSTSTAKMFVQISSRAVDESKNNDDPPLYMDNKNYVIRAINSNIFKPKEFTLFKNAKTQR